MALTKCRECGHKISKKAKTCPNCGGPVKKPGQISSGWGCLIIIAVIAALVVIYNRPDPRRPESPGAGGSTARPRRTSIPKPKNVPKYRIVEEESLDYSTVVRRGYRVSVEREMTRAELEAISWDIIRKRTEDTPVNAISIMFYLPGTDTGGAFTAGKAEWCPNGEWGDAGTVATGDYSKHKLAVKTGSAMGKVPEGTVVHSIPEAKRRAIFLALVKAQDAGVGDTKAYDVIAKRYKVSVKNVRKIGVEGVIKGWPME